MNWICLGQGNKETGYSIRGVEIVDYPALAFRALHLPRLTPKTDLKLYKKLVRMAARYKFNTLIVENSGAIKLDKHPEAYDSHGFSKKEIKELVNYMKQYHFTVIPQLNSAGHVNEWLGTEPGDLEKYHLENVFEDTTKCDLLCPSSEKAFQLLFDVYAEMMEIFESPRYFHTGLDEIHLSEFGTDKRCEYKNKPGLFAAYIDRLNEYLGMKGVKMIMWGDLLLNPEQFPSIDNCNGGYVTQFYKSVDLMKTRPIVMDWHYEKKDATATAKYFKERGFPVIPTSWFNPINIYNQAQTAKNLQLQGMCGSIWNFLVKGYDPESEIEIMSGPILQAEFMWNPDAYPIDKVPYDHQKVFKETWKKL